MAGMWGILFLYMHPISGQVDSLFQAYKAEADEDKAKAIFIQIQTRCKQDVSCYKPVVEFLLGDGPWSDLIGRTYAHLASAFISVQLMEEGKNAGLRGIERFSGHEPNQWLMMLQLSTAIGYSFLSKADSALYHADKAEQLIRSLGQVAFAYRPDYIRAVAYESLHMDKLAVHYMSRSYDYVKDSDDRMSKGFVLIGLLRLAKSSKNNTAFDYYLKEYVDFSKTGNMSPDAMHAHLEILFKEDKEGIRTLEYKIRQIMADTSSGSGGLRPTSSLLHLIDLYTANGEYEKAIYELRQMLQDTSLDAIEQTILGVYERLGRNFEQTGQIDSAYRYSVLYASALEQVYEKNLSQRIAEYEVKFQTQEKNRELAQQQLVIEQKNMRLRTLWGVLLFLGIIALIAGVFYQKRLAYQKEIRMKETEINQQRIRELEHQNTLLSLNSMIEGQETERLRIAQDLHDGLGSLLTTVKSHFSVIQREIETLKDIHFFDRTNHLIDEACQEVRRIAHDMVPHSIQISGLTGALEELQTSIEIRGISCGLEVHTFNDKTLTEQKASMIYRIIQEITSNAVKHSGASQLHIQLIGHEGMLHIMIEDNGRGFDINAVANTKGIGLRSIDSRVKYLAGEIRYDSSPQHGTTVNMELPI